VEVGTRLARARLARARLARARLARGGLGADHRVHRGRSDATHQGGQHDRAHDQHGTQPDHGAHRQARGFDQVTIAEVAEAAGVAKMTVTNYFARKEDLVFDRAEGIIRHLADVVTTRAPGESMLAAIRRDYAGAVARADVTLGLSSPEFARMIVSSPALISRALEMLDQREQALGDAIAAELGDDGSQPRVVAALLASVHRVLSAEATQRSLAGQRRAEICAWLASAATAAFDLLEPALGGYGVRPS
jgi:AcrR family transcriptional regulator